MKLEQNNRALEKQAFSMKQELINAVPMLLAAVVLLVAVAVV